MKHTPGEWEALITEQDAVVYVPDEGTIASLTDEMISYNANAKLIAAAPLQYKALIGIVDWFKKCGYDRELPQFRDCEEAIAKAE